MKTSLLLMKYLYRYRKLRLPGLGLLVMDKSLTIPEVDDNQTTIPNGVTFQRMSVTAPDTDLVSFISENTGKIKPLAAADLDSFLSLGIEMLNIGKPFLLEGIGTISRLPSGTLEFTPGHLGVMPVESHSGEMKKKKTESASSATNEILTDRRFLLRGVALLAAVLIIGGGGYIMYKNHSPAGGFTDSTLAVTGSILPEETAPPAADTSRGVVKPKTETVLPAAAPDSSLFRFVILSTSNKAHALRRYNQLLSIDLKARLFQQDSSFFKVYFQFPAHVKDTVHIKDSLRRQYAHEVLIER